MVNVTGSRTAPLSFNRAGIWTSREFTRLGKPAEAGDEQTGCCGCRQQCRTVLPACPGCKACGHNQIASRARSSAFTIRKDACGRRFASLPSGTGWKRCPTLQHPRPCAPRPCAAQCRTVLPACPGWNACAQVSKERSEHPRQTGASAANPVLLVSSSTGADPVCSSLILDGRMPDFHPGQAGSAVLHCPPPSPHREQDDPPPQRARGTEIVARPDSSQCLFRCEHTERTSLISRGKNSPDGVLSQFVERMQHAQSWDVIEMPVVREHCGIHAQRARSDDDVLRRHVVALARDLPAEFARLLP